LEDPAEEPPPYVFQRDRRSGRRARQDYDDRRSVFAERATQSQSTASHEPATLLTALNDLGRDNGIGRLDLSENRFVGMKSRGIYETPGGTILHVAHRAMESITLDREARHLKDCSRPRYAERVYYGFWFRPSAR
jgi:argininosuccinate synthase